MALKKLTCLALFFSLILLAQNTQAYPKFNWPENDGLKKSSQNIYLSQEHNFSLHLPYSYISYSGVMPIELIKSADSYRNIFLLGKKDAKDYVLYAYSKNEPTTNFSLRVWNLDGENLSSDAAWERYGVHLKNTIKNQYASFGLEINFEKEYILQLGSGDFLIFEASYNYQGQINHTIIATTTIDMNFYSKGLIFDLQTKDKTGKGKEEFLKILQSLTIL